MRLLCVAASFAVLGWYLPAQEAPARGRVLLLRTERALEGDIEKVGSQFRIRRGNSETHVPAEQALRLYAGWDEVVAHMRARANLDDPDEHLRLARWCHMHHLERLALEEARLVLELRPDQPEAKRLVALFERRSAESAPKAAPPRSEAAAALPAPDVDLGPESMIAFKTRVQPILMNACASCHAGNHAGAFRLYRVTEGGQHSSTRRNLAMVLKYVNLEDVALSPLLLKSFSPHGGAAQPPIKGKDATAFAMLETWIARTAATNPHLRAARLAPARLAASVTAAAQPLPLPNLASEPVLPVSAPAPAATPPPSTNPAAGPVLPVSAPAATGAPPANDTFGPEIFNKQFAPKN
jgi:hypothetical protein